MTEIQKYDISESDKTPQVELWRESFNKYCASKSVTGKSSAFYLMKSPDQEDPEGKNTGLMLARVALSDLEGKLGERKYVTLQTFYDDGDFGTIDLVRLPKGMHADIVREYLGSVLPKEIARDIEFDPQSTNSRFLTAGGHLELIDGKLRFHSSSGSFANRFGTYNVNDIASYLLSQSGLDEARSPEEFPKGQEYLGRCLDLMATHKKTPRFYSGLVDISVKEPALEGEGVGSHLLYSMLLMKSIDRAIAESKPVPQVLAEELTGGIGRDMLFSAVLANRMRQSSDRKGVEQ